MASARNTKQMSGMYVVDVSLKSGLNVFKPDASDLDAFHSKKIDFDEFKSRYIEKMRESYKKDKRLWKWMAGRNNLIFGCDCNDGDHCHAIILAKDIFTNFGDIKYRGEFKK